MINLVFKILLNVIFNRLERVVLMEELIKKVEQWSMERNLHTADPNKQRLKLWEEFGELNAAIARDNRDGVVDAIGDMLVVLIIYCQQNNWDREEIFKTKKTLEQNREALDQDLTIAIDVTSGAIYLSDVHESAVRDVVTCLGFISAKYGTTLKDCLQSAYDEIKDRRGKMVNGVFVKESDLKN